LCRRTIDGDCRAQGLRGDGLDGRQQLVGQLNSGALLRLLSTIADTGGRCRLHDPGRVEIQSDSDGPDRSDRGLPMLKRLGSLVIVTALSCTSAGASTHRQPSQTAIASQIKADVAQIIAGINAKDIDKATKFDAPDLISMESMRAPSLGAKADRDGLSMAFKYAPSWHLNLIDEAVDVASSGDMAVYRSTYSEDSMRDGVPYTHTGNYLAGFRRDPDGMWRVHWSVVCWQSPSRKKGG
jgi:ketosteroid isomerase-like protein